MAESTETDPRYHAAYQRGYEGPAPERSTREEERFRRPRRTDGRSRRPAAEPVAEPSGAERPAPPEQESPFAALSFVTDETPTLPAGAAPLAGATPPGTAPLADSAADPEGEASSVPAPIAATFDLRRMSLTLAAIGGVLVAVGLLALWRSAQSWYSSSPIQDTFGVEQYLRELTNGVIQPSLTVGLVALCCSVVVPLVRAVRR